MRGLLAAALCVGCASGADGVGSSATDGTGGAADGGTGGDESFDSGGSPGSGGYVPESGGSGSGGSGDGGSVPETGGGAGSGGTLETGGSGDGGDPGSGGDGTGGEEPSSGGAPAGGSGSGGSSPVVVWSGSYDGSSLATNGDEFLTARLYLDYPDCPVSLGILFEPGDSGPFTPESTHDLSCANPDKAPVAQFGPMEWTLEGSTGTLTPESAARFTLYVFDAAPWPATNETDVYVSFEWEILSPL